MELVEKKKRRVKQRHPSQFLVYGFLIVIAIGTVLLSLPISIKDTYEMGLFDTILTALFTATSATCVTGLVVVDTAEHWTLFGQIIILLLIQIGGLGFMTFATLFAIMLGRRITYSERVLIQESLNQFKMQGIVKLAKHIFFMTIIIEVAGAILLSIQFIPEYGIGKGIWLSLFHAISAFCNAGFDLMSGDFVSLTAYVTNPLINIVMILLIVLGGLGFVVILDVIKKHKFRKFSLHSKIAISMTIILLSFSFISIFLMEFNNPDTIGNYSLGNKIMSALFHAVTPRTAGFNTLDLSQMEDGSVFLTTIMMFIGGSSGSTAGGMKITTIAVVALTIFATVRGRANANVFKKKLTQDIVNKSMAIIGVGIFMVLTVTLILTVTEEANFFDIFFEAVSAIGTVGLSRGLTPQLTNLGRIVIAVTMFFGRLGPLTVFLALAYRRERQTVKYPDGKVIVG